MIAQFMQDVNVGLNMIAAEANALKMGRGASNNIQNLCIYTVHSAGQEKNTTMKRLKK